MTPVVENIFLPYVKLFKNKNDEIWLSPMTEAHTPT